MDLLKIAAVRKAKLYREGNLESGLCAVILLLSVGIPSKAMAGRPDDQVCDAAADYSLGLEDYSEAIRRHVEVVRQHPGNALAHYHLGFALGMLGDRKAEVRDYQQARALGLRDWDLFLNLGLAQIETGDLNAATESMRQAVHFGGDHSESHFNLALVEERLGMLADAEHETLASLQLSSGQPDARNLLGVIYAQQGRTARASQVWDELVRDVRDYEPARTNLSLLSSGREVPNGEMAAVMLPIPMAAVTAKKDEHKTSLARMQHIPSPNPTR